MLFNSTNFALFLPVVFTLYWFVTNRNLKYQNLFLLVASYFFYACWDWRFLFLLIFSTLLDFALGLKIHKTKSQRNKLIWLWLSIVINLGFLAVFKYYNFFAESFANGLSLIGFKAEFITLQVVLPVGISFYTFHGLSYVIDLYKGRIEPERNFINYSVFVSFFPLLVAGPIERATHLLPQILKKREFDYAKAVDGLKQILWGIFKKVVIADNCAVFANLIFNHSADYNGSTLVIGALFFTFQIYGDFSGYSDIAIGVAKLFGIDLLRNFAFPYFSRDNAEYWRRWHISLSSWFRDYLYIPLGGSKGGTWQKIRNVLIIFLLSGFWHGANWTYIVWGLLNGLYVLPSVILKTNRTNLEIVAKGKQLPTIKEFFHILITFCLTVFGFIIFRSNTISQAFDYIKTIFSTSLFTAPHFEDSGKAIITGWLIIFFLIVEWLGREQQYAIEKLGIKWPKPIRWAMYYTIIIALCYFAGSKQQFIYFQF